MFDLGTITYLISSPVFVNGNKERLPGSSFSLLGSVNQ